MERFATVEVFERANECEFILVAEPAAAVEGLKQHLAAQKDEVSIFEPIGAGNIGVNLLNGKNLDEVLKGAAYIRETYPHIRPKEIDVQL